jgi:dienelactone hydrolase
VPESLSEEFCIVCARRRADKPRPKDEHDGSRLASPLAMVTRRRLVIVIAMVVAVLAAARIRRDFRGWSLVVRAANLQGTPRRLADLDAVAVQERLLDIPLRQASIRGRAYTPARGQHQTVLLVSGLHPAGIDEPRLMSLARTLAAAGVTVVTPDIPELSQLDITPAITDGIDDSAVWLATRSGLASTGRIGLMGISFSGGLSVVAAGRPSLRNRLLYVFSLGGHDDLLRVLQYFCAAPEANARHEAVPHDYGVAIVLLSVARELVPPAEVDPLRDAVRRFLWASYLAEVDQGRAEREFAAVRALETTMPPPAATLLHYVNERDVVHLGPLLQPYVGANASAAALSPARSPLPSAPVFLLHGRDDNVIPASESQHMADRLSGRVPVRLLVTELISHTEADRPARPLDVLRLADFWGDLLSR